MNAVNGGFFVVLGSAMLIHCDVSSAQRPRDDFCGLARIQNLAAGQSAAVYSLPEPEIQIESRKIDALENGATVYVCDSTRNWYEVFYGTGQEPCGTVSEKGLPFEETRSCKAGWVSKKFVEILSG